MARTRPRTRRKREEAVTSAGLQEVSEAKFSQILEEYRINIATEIDNLEATLDTLTMLEQREYAIKARGNIARYFFDPETNQLGVVEVERGRLGFHLPEFDSSETR